MERSVTQADCIVDREVQTAAVAEARECLRAHLILSCSDGPLGIGR